MIIFSFIAGIKLRSPRGFTGIVSFAAICKRSAFWQCFDLQVAFTDFFILVFRVFARVNSYRTS